MIDFAKLVEIYLLNFILRQNANTQQTLNVSWNLLKFARFSVARAMSRMQISKIDKPSK